MSHLLPTDDPLYPHQQTFLEVAARSGATDPAALFVLADQDYFETFGTAPPEEVQALFHRLAPVHAQRNKELRCES